MLEQYTGTYSCIKTAWGYNKGDIITSKAYEKLKKEFQEFFITTDQFNRLKAVAKKK